MREIERKLQEKCAALKRVLNTRLAQQIDQHIYAYERAIEQIYAEYAQKEVTEATLAEMRSRMNDQWNDLLDQSQQYTHIYNQKMNEINKKMAEAVILINLRKNYDNF